MSSFLSRRNKAFFQAIETLEARRLLSTSPLVTFVGTPETSGHITVGNGLHVDALSSDLGTTDPKQVLNVNYKWDFGDTTGDVSASNPDQLPGFNAAHVYDTPGTYAVKLTITDAADPTGISYTKNIVVDAISSNTDIYVTNTGAGGTHSGSISDPVTSVSAAQTLLASDKFASPDGYVTIHFLSSKTFIGTSTASVPPINVAGYHNVIITSDGTGSSRPVLEVSSTDTNSSFIGGNSSTYNIQVENVQFSSTATSFFNRGINVGGNDWVIRNCAVPDDKLDYWIDAPSTNRVLVAGNTVGELKEYALYAGSSGGSDPYPTYLVMLGNTVANEVDTGGNVRVYASHELFYGNDMTNTNTAPGDDPASMPTFRAPNGSYLYWANNTLHGGTLSLEPITTGATDQYVVVENNHVIDTAQSATSRHPRVDMDGPVSDAVLRNNIIEYSHQQGINIGIGTTYGRATDIRILQNTLIDTSTDTCSAIKVSGSTADTDAVLVENNLQAVTGSGYTGGANYDGEEVIESGASTSATNADVLTGTSTTTRNTGNIWYKTSTANPSTLVINYFYNSGNVGAGRRTIAQWDSLTSGSSDEPINDQLETVTLDGSFNPTSSGSAVPNVGVLLDYNGNARSLSGNVTAGAIELNPVTSLYPGVDIGSPTPAGSTTELTHGVDYDMTAGGPDIWGTADAFQFANQSVTGDFDIAVKIASMTNTSLTAKAGLMARESLAAGSREAFMAATPATGTDVGFKFVTRGTTNGSSSSVTKGTLGSANWVRLQRIGSQIIGYYSTDGVNWTLSSSHTFSSLPSTIYVGMAATSATTSAATSVQFRGLAAVTAFGHLTINGTTGADTLTAAASGTDLDLTLNGTTIAFTPSNVTDVTFAADAGNDSLIFSNAQIPINYHEGTGSDALEISSGTYTLDNTGYAHNPLAVTVDSGATLTLDGTIAVASLNIAGSATLTSGGAKVLTTNTLSFTGSGKLDLTDNDMIIDYTGTSPLGTWTGTAYNGIDGYIETGYNAGAWNGNGIYSSLASGTYTMLAAAEASDVLGISGSGTGTFSGKTVDATSVLIKYTYGGDADLNGEIDSADYARINANVGSSGSVFGYAAGDFNYDGRIDADDYFIIDSNYSSQGSPL